MAVSISLIQLENDTVISNPSIYKIGFFPSSLSVGDIAKEYKIRIKIDTSSIDKSKIIDSFIIDTPIDQINGIDYGFGINKSFVKFLYTYFIGSAIDSSVSSFLRLLKNVK